MLILSLGVETKAQGKFLAGSRASTRAKRWTGQMNMMGNQIMEGEAEPLILRYTPQNEVAEWHCPFQRIV